MKLNRKISLATGMFTTTILLLTGVLVIQQWFSTLQTQLELSAQDLAVTISEMESLQYNLTLPNGSIPIQRRMDELKLSTRTQYIYVLNKFGDYYSHTVPALQGTREEDPFIQSILTSSVPEVRVRRTGTSRFPAVEAAAPVFYQGELVGLVITGFLNGRMYQDIRLNIQTFSLFLILAVFISLYSSALLSFSIKRSMSGLEPEEISRLLGQRAMTLENLKEGIVTIDQLGNIIYFNASAIRLAGLREWDLNQSVQSYFFSQGFQFCLDKKRTISLELLSLTGLTLQCRFEPIFTESGDEVLGATLVMEDLTIVRLRAEELTGIKQINEGLRAQNHEFLNKLHTISGLIQLEEYDEAVQFITGISRNRKSIVGRLSDRIKDSSVAGLLLGKYNKAQEQQCEFYLDDKSFLPNLKGMSDTLNLILGNLIENALEELAGNIDGILQVGVYQSGQNLRILVRDNGQGIANVDHVFKRGFSSKGPDRGLGLFLIKERVNREDGHISLETRPGHTEFIVEIPYIEEEVL
ncbi:GHKL domain-containing protein [Oceanispirochaeta crateris]|uniref:GHKL domain-containing protein n=1 Tax=Oceanispirochaeta crateris TaxID=2518645 RepID=A0A5C1QKR1_9SPIO|nr:ATP-binding protein [Oceanispirochaeta crateris]QEN08745.1 GHKL domain-containing protein [Oceanispirochaeta crateris]